MASSSVAPSEETSTPEDCAADSSRSLPLSAARQAVVDDIIALYCCHPTHERILRYSPDAIYDDQFVYCNDRSKIAGQWFALPQLFEASTNEGYRIVRSDADVIQFKMQQTWRFRVITPDAPIEKLVTPLIDSLITLTLDPETVHSETMRVKHHGEQASEDNYNQELLGFTFKKWQAEQVSKHMDSPEVEIFKKC